MRMRLWRALWRPGHGPGCRRAGRWCRAW